MVENFVDVEWIGTLREIMTCNGRFRRGHPKRVSREIAIQLTAKYPGFRLIGNENKGFLGDIAKRGAKIALVRNGGLGDVLAVAFFLGNPIERAHSNTTVDLFTKPIYIPLLQYTPFLSNVRQMPGDLSKYDASVDLCWKAEREDPRSEQVRPEIFASPIGDLADFEFDFWEFPLELKEVGRNLLSDQGCEFDRPLVGIQITSASPIRTYPISYLADLLKLLIDGGFDVAVFGLDLWKYGLKQWKGDHLFNFVDDFSLLDVSAVVSLSDFFIAPDSGLLHLSSVMGIPTLGLFGNIKPENRIKYYPRTIAMFPMGELECVPCGDVYNPCPSCSNLAGTQKSGKCMHLLFPERVFKTFLAFIEEQSCKSDVFGTMIEDIKCPFCQGEGELVNVIQGKWYQEYYPDKVHYYQCIDCQSIFSDPSLKPIKYEENYWIEHPDKYSGRYFTEEHDRVHQNMFNKVNKLFLDNIS
jgi:ADP-heptose:LPS heptosyltransferase